MLSFSLPPPKYLLQPLQITFSKVGVNRTLSVSFQTLLCGANGLPRSDLPEMLYGVHIHMNHRRCARNLPAFRTFSHSVVINTLPLKRAASDDGSSTNWSLNSLSKENKKKKYVNAYLSNSYGETDFGDDEDRYPKWMIDSTSISSLLREYRLKSVEGAQMRKHLSDSRVLSLSYIFLLSLSDRCIFSAISPAQKAAIIKDLALKNDFKRVGNDVVAACRDMQIIVEDEEKSEDEKEDQLHTLKSQSKDSDVKVAYKIVASLYQRLVNGIVPSNQKEGEAAQIIEAMRPVFANCLISQLKGIKHEWLTYHLEPHANNQTNQIMIPDLVLFVDPFTGTNLELCFVEVKRPGNQSNGHNENDLIKIGKEMQLAINKLVLYGVKSPEVVGILVQGYLATIYKMDLAFNGQYRMMKISNFRFLNNNSDDIMILPCIIEKLNQVKRIIDKTMSSLYKAIEKEEKDESLSTYTRNLCEGPVAVRAAE